MPIQNIQAFLVYPKKGEDEPRPPRGTEVPLEGEVYPLLLDIWEKSDHECKVDITFKPDEDGEQNNVCRSLITDYLEDFSIFNARRIAQRLEHYTDRRSGKGLLFLINGREGRDHKLVISRFPADNAIHVNERPGALSVRFLRDVFLRNMHAYKAVLYRDRSIEGGFWSGRAIDKQLERVVSDLSRYWIKEFLLSDLSATSAAGTRQLAKALRDALKGAPLSVKQELTAAATLAEGLGGSRISINEFGEHFNLSPEAMTILSTAAGNARVAGEMFEFDIDEFRSIVAFRAVALSNGATLSAPAEKFDEVFTQEPVDEPRARGGRRRVRFSTVAEILDEKLKAGV